jgi:prepilin-type N-terminal cleavage/methylation domain-containing protein
MTMVELLVVMLIFGILVGLGYSAILEYRTSVEFRSANQELESFLQTVENMARNNVLPPNYEQNILDSDFAGYLVRFNFDQENLLSTFICNFDRFSGNYSCSLLPNTMKMYPLIQLKRADEDVSIQCGGIFFQKLSSNMRLIDGGLGTADSNYSSFQSDKLSDGFCNILIQNIDNVEKYSNIYTFNSITNSYVKED